MKSLMSFVYFRYPDYRFISDKNQGARLWHELGERLRFDFRISSALGARLWLLEDLKLLRLIADFFRMSLERLNLINGLNFASEKLS